MGEGTSEVATNTGEYLALGTVEDDLQAKCATLQTEVTHLRTGIESLAIRHHHRQHGSGMDWRACPFTTCREAAAILDSA